MYEVNKFKKAIWVAGSLIAILSLGCSKKATEIKQSSLAKTNFKIAGSVNSATVAKTNLEKFLSRLIPSAQANVPSSMLSKDNQNVTLSSLWIVLKELEFKSAETNESEDSEEQSEGVAFKGPYVANLLDINPTALDTQNIPIKSYKRIKMQYEKVDTSVLLAKNPNAPTELANNSIYMAGTCGSSCSFTFKLDDGVEVEIAGPNGLAAQDNQDLLVSIQLANVIKQINFLDLAAATDKNITHSNRVIKSISTDLCPAIDSSALDYYTCFKKGLEKESRFAKDDDGDGEIDDTEDSVKPL